jgi:hypothetical protein
VWPKLSALLLALSAGASISSVRADSRVQVTIPTRTQVGAQCLPEGIAPVKAPFPMPGNEIITRLQGEATANLRFQDCTPEKPKDWKTTSN